MRLRQIVLRANASSAAADAKKDTCHQGIQAKIALQSPSRPEPKDELMAAYVRVRQDRIFDAFRKHGRVPLVLIHPAQK
jgi:hypothetical protein